MKIKSLLIIWLCVLLAGATVTFIVVDRSAKEDMKKRHRESLKVQPAPAEHGKPPAHVQIPDPPVQIISPASADTGPKDYEELDKGLRLYTKQSRIEVDGKISVQKGLIELIATGVDGKDYESIIVVECRPDMLHSGLLLLGLNDKEKYGGGGPRWRADNIPPVGDRVKVSIKWKNEKGEEVIYPAEELVYNRRTGLTMAHAGWVFLGSQFIPEVDPDTGKITGREIYAANMQKIIVATLHDPTAIIDTPLADGGNDEVFYANENLLPAPGTAAVLMMEVPTEKEKEEMLKNENGK
ncbi:MAG: hypothetical protein HZA48_01385 [Planctomycetes bacterium]|nr:hypothetical protein [Planctomycetota bacterium]